MAVSHIAWGQAYPSRTVTMIVPFAAGGSTDVAARVVGEHMSRTLGQQFIVDNVAGAGGTTGSIRAMRAKPDGQTIQMGNLGTHAFSVSLYPTSPISRMSISSQLAWSSSSLSSSWLGRTFPRKT